MAIPKLYTRKDIPELKKIVPIYEKGKYLKSTSKYGSILDKKPDLENEWLIEVNQYLLSEVSSTARDKFAWVCDKGHIFLAIVYNRTHGSNCYFCYQENKSSIIKSAKLIQCGSLQEKYPELAKEWDPNKNGDITPDLITPQANDKYWWICNRGHESFHMSPNSRINRGSGCSLCYQDKKPEIARKHFLKNNLTLLDLDPFLAKQFDVKKNGRRADEINSQSGLNVWWICPNGHSFQMIVSHRFLRGGGCTSCSKTGTSRIQILIENELRCIFPDLEDNKPVHQYSIDCFIPSLKIAIEYDGKHVHEQEKDLIKNKVLEKEGYRIIRIREYPLKKTTELDIVFKASQNFEQIKNMINSVLENIKTLQISENLCDSIDNYIVNPNLQAEKKWRQVWAEFPKPKPELQLKNTNPKLSEEWDYLKNYPLTPESYMGTSTYNAWWLCRVCGHSWQNRIDSRHSRGDGCNECYGKVRAETIRKTKLKRTGSIKKTHPKLIDEWNYELNEIDPNNISAGSETKVWWNCTKGHEPYPQAINCRTGQNQGCPICGKLKQREALIKRNKTQSK